MKRFRRASVRWAFLVLLIAGGLSACDPFQPAAGPDETMRRFADAWERGDSGSMYALLTERSRGIAGKSEFHRLLRRMRAEIGVTGARITVRSPAQSDEYDAMRSDMSSEPPGAGAVRPDLPGDPGSEADLPEERMTYRLRICYETYVGAVHEERTVYLVRERGRWGVEWRPELPVWPDESNPY